MASIRWIVVLPVSCDFVKVISMSCVWMSGGAGALDLSEEDWEWFYQNVGVWIE